MTDEVWKRPEVDSPCTKVCVIHRDTGYCTGCLRTLDEIAGWGGFSDADRAAILDGLADRKHLLTQRRGGRAGRLRRSQSSQS